jgi:FkbM family methyltransferase
MINRDPPGMSTTAGVLAVRVGKGGHPLPEPEPAPDWQSASASHLMILLRCLVNTIRLATGPAEVASVLRFFFKFLVWRLTGSSSAERDETLRLQGVTHVIGLGTGELLMPPEIYWQRVYDRRPDFVPQPGWIVFDVGANTGVYAVQQARRGAHVYAFEPNPACYRRLQKAVRAHDLEGRVMTVNRALGATAGSAELLLPAGLTILGSLRPEWAPGGDGIRVRVEVETVDQVVSTLGINRIDLLKVDVEGFELDVLQGARETLAIIDRLVIEYHSLDLGRRVVELLAERGLTTVLDERTYRGDENMYRGCGRGLLFAKREGGSFRGAGPADSPTTDSPTTS